jgi:alpha-beta hydrolase superfamily lysophospholipase
LATTGLAALRFHYRGFGHSDGDGSDATFQSMRADTLAAIEQVQAATGAAPVALLGVRLGALIAASAAHELDDAPLVLWQPVADPARYFRDATRARRVHRLRSDASGGSGGGSLAEELRRGEPADVLGYPLHRALYETLAGRTLAQELGPRPRSILLVQMSPRPQLDPEHARLVEALERSGAPVDVKLVSAEPAWWFARGVTRTPPAVRRAIADWVVARLGGEQP